MERIQEIQYTRVKGIKVCKGQRKTGNRDLDKKLFIVEFQQAVYIIMVKTNYISIYLSLSLRTFDTIFLKFFFHSLGRRSSKIPIILRVVWKGL